MKNKGNIQWIPTDYTDCPSKQMNYSNAFNQREKRFNSWKHAINSIDRQTFDKTIENTF